MVSGRWIAGFIPAVCWLPATGVVPSYCRWLLAADCCLLATIAAGCWLLAICISTRKGWMSYSLARSPLRLPGSADIICWLVVWTCLEHVDDCPIQLGTITPTDELIFFRGVGIPPTSMVCYQSYYLVIYRPIWGYSQLSIGYLLGITM